MSERNIRRHRRIPYTGPVRISWQGQESTPRYVRGRCLDVSESGMRVEAPEPIPVRTLVLLSAERIKLSGSATVRHVTRQGAKYVLGLELNVAMLQQTLTLASQPERPETL